MTNIRLGKRPNQVPLRDILTIYPELCSGLSRKQDLRSRSTSLTFGQMSPGMTEPISMCIQGNQVPLRRRSPHPVNQLCLRMFHKEYTLLNLLLWESLAGLTDLERRGTTTLESLPTKRADPFPRDSSWLSVPGSLLFASPRLTHSSSSRFGASSFRPENGNRATNKDLQMRRPPFAHPPPLAIAASSGMMQSFAPRARRCRHLRCWACHWHQRVLPRYCGFSPCIPRLTS